ADRVLAVGAAHQGAGRLARADLAVVALCAGVEAVVDHAVAVVVEAVAQLGDGRLRVHARAELAAGAGPDARVADALARVRAVHVLRAAPDVRRVARLDEAVDDAVAVVVLPVADLGRGPDRAHALPALRAHALEVPRLALPDVDAAGRTPARQRRLVAHAV